MYVCDNFRELCNLYIHNHITMTIKSTRLGAYSDLALLQNHIALVNNQQLVKI